MSSEKEIFAQKLNYYMNRNGKTQTDLINDLNINKSTISTWCNGTKMPRMGTIQTLADYFGIMKSDLIEEKPATIKDDGLDVDARLLLAIYDRLEYGQRRELLKYAKFQESEQNQ